MGNFKPFIANGTQDKRAVWCFIDDVDIFWLYYKSEDKLMMWDLFSEGFAADFALTRYATPPSPNVGEVYKQDEGEQIKWCSYNFNQREKDSSH